MNLTRLTKRLIRTKFLSSIFFLKLCWTQAYSYVGIPMKLVQLGSILMILFNQYGVPVQYALWLGISVLLFILGVGAYMLKFGIIERENSFNNQYNPELMKIYNRGQPNSKCEKVQTR